MIDVNITITGKLESEELITKIYETANGFKKEISELISNPTASVFISEGKDTGIILD